MNALFLINKYYWIFLLSILYKTNVKKIFKSLLENAKLYDNMSKNKFYFNAFWHQSMEENCKTLLCIEKVPAILQKKYQLKFTKVPAIADSWWLF